MQRVGEKFKQAHSILGVEGGGKVERKEKGGGKGGETSPLPKDPTTNNNKQANDSKSQKIKLNSIVLPQPHLFLPLRPLSHLN